MHRKEVRIRRLEDSSMAQQAGSTEVSSISSHTASSLNSMVNTEDYLTLRQATVNSTSNISNPTASKAMDSRLLALTAARVGSSILPRPWDSMISMARTAGTARLNNNTDSSSRSRLRRSNREAIRLTHPKRNKVVLMVRRLVGSRVIMVDSSSSTRILGGNEVLQMRRGACLSA